MQTRRFKKRAASYVRVSTYQEKQEKSLADQIAMLNKIIDDDDTLINVGTYIDQGITGKYQSKRKQFLKLVRDCIEGRIDVVYVKQMRRFGRNTLETIQTIEKLRAYGVAIRFVMDGIDTIEDRGCSRLTMLANMAEEERDSLQETMIWSFQHRMEQGDYVFRPDLLFGYALNKNKEMVIVEKEAKAVRYIFETYAAGGRVVDIETWLNEHGYITRKGNPFCKSSIGDILQNEKYYGDLLIGKTRMDGPRRVRNEGESPMYLHEGHHEGIISKELFDKCQEVRQSRHYTTKKDYSDSDIFCKKVYCGQCGSLYFRQGRVNCVSDFSQTAFACGLAVRSKRSKCRNKLQRIGTLKDGFVAVYNFLYDNRSTLNEIVVENEEYNEIVERLKELCESEKMYFEAEVKGLMNEQMKRNHTRLVGEVLKLEKRKRFLLSRNFEISSCNHNLKKCNKVLRETGKIADFRDELFDLFVQKVLVMDRNNLVYELTSGHKISVEVLDNYKTRDEIRRVYVSE